MRRWWEYNWPLVVLIAILLGSIELILTPAILKDLESQRVRAVIREAENPSDIRSELEKRHGLKVEDLNAWDQELVAKAELSVWNHSLPENDGLWTQVFSGVLTNIQFIPGKNPLVCVTFDDEDWVSFPWDDLQSDGFLHYKKGVEYHLMRHEQGYFRLVEWQPEEDDDERVP